MRTLLLLALITGLVASESRTGDFQMTLTETSPQSEWSTLSGRYSLGKTRPSNAVYDLSQESYNVYVPRSYDGSTPYGLIAYIAAGAGGGPAGYREQIEKHKLIWIGGSNIGNERNVWIRMSITLDAVHNARKLFNIDDKRIYVSGVSGGGRCASRMAVTWADIFSGGIYLIGCDPMIWPGDKAAADLVRTLAPTRRFAFMTGSNDFNRDGTKAVFEGYRSSGFQHIEYYETPGMGHDMPPGDWFDRAITFCDAPLIAAAEVAFARGEALAAKNKLVDAYAAYREAISVPVATEVAAKARPKIEELRAAIEIDLSADLDKQLANKPKANRLRDYARTWKDFPAGVRAAAAADELAAPELDEILAKKEPQRLTPLRTFAKDWTGFPVGDRAIAALDELARPARAEVDAEKSETKRLKSLAKFVAEWAPTPTATAAAADLDSALRAELEAIKSIEKPRERGQRLQTFAKTWKGTPAAADAERALADLIAELTPAK